MQGYSRIYNLAVRTDGLCLHIAVVFLSDSNLSYIPQAMERPAVIYCRHTPLVSSSNPSFSPVMFFRLDIIWPNWHEGGAVWLDSACWSGAISGTPRRKPFLEKTSPDAVRKHLLGAFGSTSNDLLWRCIIRLWVFMEVPYHASSSRRLPFYVAASSYRLSIRLLS